MSDDKVDGAAYGVAAWYLTMQILVALRGSKVFSDQQTKEIAEVALENLEIQQMGSTSHPEISDLYRKARKPLELLAHEFSRRSSP